MTISLPAFLFDILVDIYSKQIIVESEDAVWLTDRRSRILDSNEYPGCVGYISNS